MPLCDLGCCCDLTTVQTVIDYKAVARVGGDKPKKKGPPEGVYRLVFCRGECLRRLHAVFTQGTEYRLFGVTEAFDRDGVGVTV